MVSNRKCYVLERLYEYCSITDISNLLDSINHFMVLSRILYALFDLEDGRVKIEK
jgi:hypothetical protein